MEKVIKIQKAKKALEDAGYYCGSLWSLLDVQEKYNCTEEDAYRVLDKALNNEVVVEQIYVEINSEVKKLNK